MDYQAGQEQSLFNNIINNTGSNAVDGSGVSGDSSNTDSGTPDTNGLDSGIKNSNNIANETVKNTAKMTGIKAASAGVASLMIIAGGIFAYNNIKANNNVEIPVAIEENASAESVSNDEAMLDVDKDSIRMEVSDLNRDILSIYEVVKTQCFLGLDNWNINYIISEIKIIDYGEAGGEYDSTYVMWSRDYIEILKMM